MKETLLLADVLQKFRNMCLEIYELDPASFLLATRLGCQAALKKSKNPLIDKNKKMMIY